MDRRELNDNPITPLQMLGDLVKSQIWTALPAIVMSVDLGLRKCNVKPTIKAKLTPVQIPKNEEFEEWVELPELQDCPIIMPKAGNYVLSLPVSAGDEGLVIIASRCIDGWWEYGGIQEQLDLRMHDLSDGFFLPGVWSKPSAMAGGLGGIGLPEPNEPISGDAMSLRSADGLTAVTLSSEVLSVKHPVLITLDAPMILANGVPIP